MNHAPFVDLLSSASGSCGDIRKELENIHGFKISGGTYQSLWQSLVAAFGFEGAALVVEDAIDLISARKAMLRIMGKREKSLVSGLLMKDVARARARGRPYLVETQAVENSKQASPPRGTRKKIISHTHLHLPDVKFGRGTATAKADGYRSIVSLSNNHPLKARSNWQEKHLENYLEKHWESLDFGIGHSLELIGRQVRLSESREKVDLLARSENVVIPIELKIKQTGGSDLTQLQSYRQDLINREHSAENVLGVLVAPKFSTKVMNVVRGNQGVVLRWFQLPM